MKICWDNLKKAIFTKNGTWRIGTQTYYEKMCKNCGEYYLGKKESEFCNNSCSMSNIFNPQYKKVRPITHCNKISLSKIGKNYNGMGKDHHSWKCGKLSWYDTYAHQISWAEEVRRAQDNENILEVKCKYCGKWFKPTSKNIINRIGYLNSKSSSEYNLYCSNECKHSCPIYYKQKYPVGFTGEDNSSREVQPELRKLVLERDNYTCQKCGINSNEQCVELHCHHINPVVLDPLESADIDNCITLCKDCHYETHQKDGCKTGQLANCINI